MSDLQINKTYTSNPFVDYILYYTKILAFGSVIKDDDDADRNETEASMMAGDILISCVENSVIFELFTYTKDELIAVGITDPFQINRCISDRNNIPLSKRDAITELARQDYITNYVELNPYYRKICGLPPINDYGIPVRDYEYNFVDNINPWNVTYIHELNHDAIMYLEQKGILDQIRMDYPNADYLDYITCNITPYKARKAYDYQLLYYPEDADHVVQEKFVRKYDENRLYTIATYYSEGLKLASKYYSNFIGMMIMIMTMVDMLCELPEHIIKKDLLDKRCIQYIFEMYNIPYYDSIPIKYQYRMCKNINQLIRYKSCAQGMINLIDLFGAENIDVFKYFILRDRNTDKWGDIVYNQIETSSIRPNDIIEHEETLLHGPFNRGRIIDIPFPVPDFLEFGNLLDVFGDGIQLKEGIDYTINTENKLVLNKNVTDIRFDFYFNNTASVDKIDTKNGLYIACDATEIITSRTFKFKPPYGSYVKDGNDIIVSLGGAVLGPEQYTVNTSNNTITLDSSFDLASTGDRRIVVLYLYADNIVTKYKRSFTTATSNNQTTFTIPEPFTNYVKNNNAFFVTYRNTFIQDNRYTVDAANSTITFTDIKVPVGIQVVFYFIYAEATTYQEIIIQEKEAVLTVEEDYQTEFKLLDEDGNSLYPFKNYIKSPYKIYVRVRNYDRMLDQDFYDVYSNSLVLRDTTLCLRKGEKITVLFVYGPHETMASLKVDKKNVYSSENYQTEFDIELPEPKYFSELHGGLILDIYGNYLRSSDYTIDEENSKLIITNLDKTPAADEKINLTFIRNIVSQNSIVITQQYPTFGLKYNGKPRFNISIPFAGYFESGQNVLVFHNSTLISPKRVHYSVEQLLGGTVHFLYIDDNPNEYQSTDSVVVLFVYNGLYVRQLDENIEDKVVECNIEDIIDDDLVLSIPFPYSRYLENGWFLYITDEDNIVIYRSDNDETGDDDTEYPVEIINDYLTFIDSSVIPEYNKLIFHFIHFYSPNYLYTEINEDYEANYSLKFIGVPLSEEHFTKEIMKKINVLPYDAATLEDIFWDGVAYNNSSDELHTKVKLDILKKRFNYERTKYFGINYIINISEMAFRISYFYNMLYDKYFIEDNLTIKVPSIAPYKDFNIANLFCYMTSLAYLFTGVQDYILNNFSEILFIKGFNFGADLDVLKDWLRKQFRYLAVKVYNNRDSFPETGEVGTIYIDHKTNTSYQWDKSSYISAKNIENITGYNVWDFVTYKDLDDILINDKPISDGNKQIKDMDAFIDVFTQNRDIYNLIVKSIYKSPDYDVYSIWKKLYETLMTIEYNDAFYKVTLTEEGISDVGYEDDVPGSVIVARTFKELLYYKDRELYNDIMYIQSIDDEGSKNDTIINRISDIVYILEDWMESDEFHNIYDSFPGVSGDSLVNYLFTIINFFKSYKVVLRSKGDFIIFTADDPMLNTIKLIDVKDTSVYLEKYEYLNILEDIDAGVHLYKDDTIKLQDKMSIEETISDSIPDRFYPLPEDYPYKTNNISKIRVKRTQHQYITIYTDKGDTFTTDITSGWISAISKEDSSLIGLVTYFNPFINDSDSEHPYMRIKIDDPSMESNLQYIVLDHNHPIELRSKFKTYARPSMYQHVLIRETSPGEEYIEILVEYGTEFYVYITPDMGWHAGVLNIRYGKIFDDDILVEATDATTIMRELYIYQSPNQTITLTNTGGDKITESTTVPYGSFFYLSIEGSEGYIPGTIQVSPESSVSGESIIVEKTTTISATTATLKTFRVKVTAPEHENIAIIINNATILVPAGTTIYPEELSAVPYWTEYSIKIYSDADYTAGELNIPATGQFTQQIQSSEGEIFITASPAKLNTYTITVKQSAHQTITVHYGESSYSGDGSFEVDIETHITCTIVSEDGYIAGILNITDYIVNEDLIIYATDAVEAEILLITISSGNNQTITVVYNGEEHTEDFYVPFGSAYTSYITPNTGYTTTAQIINDRSDELRNNVVVYAFKDATPNVNTITLINPDTVHQTLRVYVNNDQSEENVKTSTFSLESGNTIRAELVSNDPEYIVGTINITETITVTSDIAVIATAPTNINNVSVTVDTVDHQDIKVTYDGTTYHSGNNFIARAETTAQVEVVPDEGYQYTHSDFVPSYTFLKNGQPVLITADPPILKACEFTIEQKDHQLISVVGTARIYLDDETYEEIENYTAIDSSVKFVYGTVFNVSVESTDPEYNPGTLNITTGTVTDGIVITVTDATPIDDGQ